MNQSLFLKQASLLLLRLVITCVIVVLMVMHFEQAIMQLLIPLYKWEITALDDQFRIMFFGLVDHQGSRSLQLNVVFNHDIVLNHGGNVFASNVMGSAILLVQIILHPVIILMITLWSWPARTWKLYLLRTIVGLPFILVILMLDAPMQLLSSVINSLNNHIDSVWVAPSALIYWSDFLVGGGSFALALFAGAVTIAIDTHLYDKALQKSSATINQ